MPFYGVLPSSLSCLFVNFGFHILQQGITTTSGFRRKAADISALDSAAQLI